MSMFLRRTRGLLDFVPIVPCKFAAILLAAYPGGMTGGITIPPSGG
jgi:hypothetical protein